MLIFAHSNFSDEDILERAMHMAKQDPTNQHHTGVARPPEAKGTP
jgi:hypothetical protein